jgi:hypothetical protein
MSWFKKEDNIEGMYMSQSSPHTTQETLSEKYIWNMKNIFIAFWFLIIFIAIALVSRLFKLDFNQNVLLWTCLVIVYAIILFFLLEPSKLKEIERKEVRTIEKEVPVVKEIEKPVYYAPKNESEEYKYVASMSTKVYHLSSCRLSKSIKKKYLESSNDVSIFEKKKYKPCKACITKEVKT